MPKIQDARILIICTDGVEQLELTTPRDELRKKGARVQVATPTGRAIRAWNFTDWGQVQPADLKIADAKPDDYDALVIPGGVISPDKLRIDSDAMLLVKAFVDSDKLVAAVCHGPWLLVQADAVEGRRMTSYKSIRKDVENAGADWVDEQAVVDGRFVTSRNPDDLPAFVGAIAEQIENTGGRRRAGE
ncbi:MAG TPA: type 1 glutamine amidotransferase domain-containing protein [Roseiarcus sp.]|jgi:protease I|nr:type 1 glutamine amidotransferase domain-containing protein [Roseiarcus sp.]